MLETRQKLTEVLQAKGLAGTALSAKVEETLAKVTRPELLNWTQTPSWQSLKAMVGTRVTFISRKKEEDPLMANDPWMSALRDSKSKVDSKPPLKEKEQVQVSLIPEVWSNEDGSEPQILDKPFNGATGIVLMTPTLFSTSWQDTPLPLSTDELGVVVWPPIDPIPGNWTPDLVSFPARILSTSESTNLLRGHLFQFGQKKITLRTTESPVEFPQRSSVSLIVEAFQKELQQEMWKEILDNPMMAIRRRIEHVTPILGHWGLRFWTQKGKTSRPSEASKMSVNVMIGEDQLAATLALSGQPLWMSPRLDQEAYKSFRPVWVPGTLQEVRILHDKLQGGCGLVRSRRGLGIRVETVNFEETRRTLFPHQDTRPDIGPASGLFDYKLSPAPIGATTDDVVTFLEKSFPSIKSTVRRQIGPRTWVVSFASELTDKFIQAKEGFIILQPMPSTKKRDPMRDAVLVGNPTILRDVSASSSNTLAQIFQSNQQPSIHPRPPAPGPVQDALDAKIKASEERMKALISQQKEDQASMHQQLANKIDENKRDHDGRLRVMEQDLCKHQKETTDAVNDLKKTMSEQFATMLTEISKMNRKDAKRSPAPSPDEPNAKAVKPQ